MPLLLMIDSVLISTNFLQPRSTQLIHYHLPAIAFWSALPSIVSNGEPETMKRVFCIYYCTCANRTKALYQNRGAVTWHYIRNLLIFRPNMTFFGLKMDKRVVLKLRWRFNQVWRCVGANTLIKIRNCQGKHFC